MSISRKTPSHWREGTVDSDSKGTQRASLGTSPSSASAVRTPRDGVLLRGQEARSICDAVYYDSLHEVWAWELFSDVPKGGHRGHGPSLSALRGPPQVPKYFFDTGQNVYSESKLISKFHSCATGYLRGPRGTQRATADIRGHPVFWAPCRLGGSGRRESLIAWGPLVA